MLCLAKHYHYSLENENYSNSDGPRIVNPLTGTLKPQSNGPLYSNAVIGRLAVEGWTVTFGTARRGLGGLRPRPVPSSLYQMKQPAHQWPVYKLHIIRCGTIITCAP